MKREYCAGIVIYHVHGYERYYLLLKSVKGHWSFAKGKMEAGETKEQTAVREVAEETGLAPSIMPGFMFDHTYTFSEHGAFSHKTVYFFVGESKSMDVVLSPEHTDYKWVPYQKFVAALTHKTDAVVLEAAEQFLKKQKK